MNEKIKMKKTCIVLMGISGSGKSTFAQTLKEISGPLNDTDQIFSADKYFMVDGEYQFDVSKLGQAHQWCKDQFTNAVDNNYPLVVVDNTNTSMKESEFYLEYAEQHGYVVFYLGLVPWNKQENQHNVPTKALQSQCDKMKNTIVTCLDNHIANQPNN